MGSNVGRKAAGTTETTHLLVSVISNCVDIQVARTVAPRLNTKKSFAAVEKGKRVKGARIIVVKGGGCRGPVKLTPASKQKFWSASAS
jgi:hypothetical protein